MHVRCIRILTEDVLMGLDACTKEDLITLSADCDLGLVYCPEDVFDEAVASVDGVAEHPHIIEQRWNVKYQVSSPLCMYCRRGYETTHQSGFQRRMVSGGTNIRGSNLDSTFEHPHQCVNVCVMRWYQDIQPDSPFPPTATRRGGQRTHARMPSGPDMRGPRNFGRRRGGGDVSMCCLHPSFCKYVGWMIGVYVTHGTRAVQLKADGGPKLDPFVDMMHMG